MGRGLRYGLMALGGLLGLVMLAVASLSLTATRHALAEWGLAQLDGVIAGSVRVDEVHALTPWRIHLSGVTVNDESGDAVGEIEELDVRIAPWALWGRTLHLREVRIESPAAELGSLTQGDEALLGAVRPVSDAAGSADDTASSGGLPIDIQVDALSIHGAKATGQLEGQPVAAELPVLEARGRYADNPKLVVSALQLRVEQDARQLLELHSESSSWSVEEGGRALLSGELFGNPVDLRLDDRQQTDGQELRVDVQGGSGRAQLVARWEQGAAELSLDAQRLLLASLHESLPDLRVHGHVEATSATPFEPPHGTELRWSGVRVQSREIPDGRADLAYREPRLEVSKLRVGDEGALRGSAQVALDTLRGELELRGDGIELARFVPEAPVAATVQLDLHATRNPQGAVEVELAATAQDLQAAGVQLAKLELSGRGATTAEGSLRANLSGHWESLHASQTELPRGSLELALDGTLQAPRAEVLVRADDARLGPLPPLQLALSLSGDTRAATLELQADGPTGYGLGLRVEGARGDARISLDAEGVATLDGRRWRLTLSRARLGWEPDRQVRVAALRLRSGEQRVALQGRLDEDRVRATLSLRHLNLASLPRSGTDAPDLAGRVVRAELNVQGRTNAPTASLDAQFEGVSAAGSPPLAGDVSARVDLPESRGELHVDLQARKGKGRLRGDLRTGWRSAGALPDLAALERGEHSLDLDADCIDLALVRPYLPEGVPGLVGLAGADMTVEGTLDSLRAEGWAGLTLRSTPQSEAQRVRVSVDVSSKQSEVKLVARQGFRPLVSASVRWPESARSLIERARSPLRLLSSDFDARVDVRPGRIDRIDGSFGQWLQLARLDMPVRASGNLRLRGDGPKVDGEGKLRVVLQNRALDAGCALKAQSRLDAELWLSERRFEASLRAKTHHSGDIQAQVEIPFDLRAFVHDGSGVGLAQVTADANDVALHELPGLCALTQGQASASLTAQDVGGPHTQVRGEARVHSVQLQDEPTTSWMASLNATREGLRAEGEVEVGGERSGTFSLRLPLVTDAWPVPELATDEALSAHLRLKSVPPASLLAGVGAVGQVDGALSADLVLDGTLEAPRPSGSVELESLDFSIASIAQPFHDVTGTLRIDDGRVELDDLRIRDGDGTARVDGTVHYAWGEKLQAEAHVEVEDLPVRRNGTIVAEANTALDASFDISEQGTMEVDLKVLGGRLWLTGKQGDQVLSLEPMPEIHFASGERPEVQQSNEPPVTLDTLHLHTDEALWLMHKDFSVQVAADVKVHGGEGEEEGTTMTGAIQLVRGELNLLGNAFRVQEGEIRFTGASPPEPRLEISAVYSMPAGDDLKVSVTGRAMAPEITFSGAATTAGGAVAAMTGFGQAGAEGQAQNQASDFAISLLAGLLSVTARREFGDWVPLLAIDSNTEGIQRIRAGFDASRLIPDALEGIARGFYIEGIVGEQQGASSNDAPMTGLGLGVSAEIAFPHDVVTKGSYGPGSTWSADVGWSP